MPDPRPVDEARRTFLGQLCSDDVPPLWCCLLTHYDKYGEIDEKRTLTHLDHVANFIDGILVPGLTGDSQVLTEAERLRVAGLVLDQATRLKLRILLSTLKPDTGAARACLVGTVEWLKARTGEPDTQRCLHRRRVAAFTLCPPANPALSQDRLEEELDSLLVTGLPIALHLLPGHNGLSPTIVNRLASRHPNLVFCLDHTGNDNLAPDIPTESGLFLVRGADTQLTNWTRRAGGPYDGLLLASANCFPRELRQLWRDLSRKRVAAAQELAAKLESALQSIATAADEMNHGDRLANAHKAIDHYMAFGPHASQVPPPFIHGGFHLTLNFIRTAGDLLRQHSLLPEKGYLA